MVEQSTAQMELFVCEIGANGVREDVSSFWFFLVFFNVQAFFSLCLLFEIFLICSPHFYSLIINDNETT